LRRLQGRLLPGAAEGRVEASHWTRGLLGIALLLLSATFAGAQDAAPSRATISGLVTDGESQGPVPGAQVLVEGTMLGAITDSTGHYRLGGVPPGPQVLAVRRIGYAPVRVPLTVPTSGLVVQNVVLARSVLRLPTVVTTGDPAGRARGELGTASVIDRATIAAQTATSLAGVLELLPGVPLAPPGLDGVQQIPLRSVPMSGGGQIGGPNGGDLASFGTLILLDGVPLSNNANLQSTGPRGELQVPSSAGGGIDLRLVPASTIDRVEVIRGIPSARFGDLTQGAIVVETRAGVFEPEILLRYDPRTIEASLSGGRRLGDRQVGSVTTDVTRTRRAPSVTSAAAYRLNLQLAHRLALGSGRGDSMIVERGADGRLMLDSKLELFQLLENNPEDPAVSPGFTSRSRDAGGRFTGRATLRTGEESRFHVTTSASYTRQRSFVTAPRIRGAIPFTDRLDEGRAIGRFIGGTYQSRVDIAGDVWLLYGRAEWDRPFASLGFDHRLRVGSEVRREWNAGAGYSFDIEFPPQVSFTGVQGFDRPRPYDALPAFTASALYVDDRLSRVVGGMPLDVQAGVRLDALHADGGWPGGVRDVVVQPRLNAQLAPRRGVRLRGGWGTSAKLPSLSAIAPAPQFYDVVNVNWFTNDPAERLAVLTTFIRNPTNPDLGMATARKAEAGFEVDLGPRATVALTGFSDRTNGSVGSAPVTDFILREHFALSDSSIGTGQPPTYLEPAERVDTVPILIARPANNLRLESRGLELTTTFPQIRAIHTTILVQAAYVESRLHEAGIVFSGFSDFQLNANRLRMPFWDAATRTGERAIATYRIVHHRPEVGLSITGTVQHTMHETRQDIGQTDTLAFAGFITRDGVLTAVPAAERTQPQFADLRLARGGLLTSPNEVAPDWLLSLQVAKTLPGEGRLSFYAFNALDREGNFGTAGAGARLFPRIRYGVEATIPLSAFTGWR
jgi:hypothetical protein